MPSLVRRALAWVQDRRAGAKGFLLEGLDPREREDARMVFRARAAGIDRFSVHRERLEAVMARYPANYPEVERRGSVIILRMYEPSGGRLLAGKLEKEIPDLAAAGLTVDLLFNTYGGAAFCLGFGYVHIGDYQRAIEVLEEGLRRQPGFSTLVNELGVALEAAGRREEAVALFEDWLGRREDLSEGALQEVLLSYGQALMALDRLDEAETIFEECRGLFPHITLAAQELYEIAALRRGAPKAERVMGVLRS